MLATHAGAATLASEGASTRLAVERKEATSTGGASTIEAEAGQTESVGERVEHAVERPLTHPPHEPSRALVEFLPLSAKCRVKRNLVVRMLFARQEALAQWKRCGIACEDKRR